MKNKRELGNRLVLPFKAIGDDGKTNNRKIRRDIDTSIDLAVDDTKPIQSQTQHAHDLAQFVNRLVFK